MGKPVRVQISPRAPLETRVRQEMPTRVSLLSEFLSECCARKVVEPTVNEPSIAHRACRCSSTGPPNAIRSVVAHAEP